MKILVLYNDTAGKSEAKETAEKFQAYVNEQGDEHQVFYKHQIPMLTLRMLKRQPRNMRSIRLLLLVGMERSIMGCKHSKKSWMS